MRTGSQQTHPRAWSVPKQRSHLCGFGWLLLFAALEPSLAGALCLWRRGGDLLFDLVDLVESVVLWLLLFTLALLRLLGDGSFLVGHLVFVIHLVEGGVFLPGVALDVASAGVLLVAAPRHAHEDLGLVLCEELVGKSAELGLFPPIDFAPLLQFPLMHLPLRLSQLLLPLRFGLQT